MSEYSIETKRLKRIFKLDRLTRRELGKHLLALDDIDLQIRSGEMFGLLGPNGAGKTTLIRILCTLLSPTSGEAYIEGIDAIRDLQRVRPLINMVSGGETCGYGILNATENLRLFTELYGIPWKVAKPRVEYMLKVVGLDKFKGSKVNKLSTGMRQRVNFARGFVTNPKVLFLDEPTVGMDVHAAREIRNFIKQWLQDNPQNTILLTTHYMAEADELCDRVAIIDKGCVQACDSPASLKKIVQKETALELTVRGLEKPPESWHKFKGVVKLAVTPEPADKIIKLRVLLKSPDISGTFINEITSDGRRLLDLRTQEPSLEDVFIKLTGRRLTEQNNITISR